MEASNASCAKICCLALDIVYKADLCEMVSELILSVLFQTPHPPPQYLRNIFLFIFIKQGHNHTFTSLPRFPGWDLNPPVCLTKYGYHKLGRDAESVTPGNGVMDLNYFSLSSPTLPLFLTYPTAYPCFWSLGPAFVTTALDL